MSDKKNSILDKMIKKPITLIAPAYPILLVALVGLGLYFIANENALVLNQIPPRTNDTLGVVKELELLEPKVSSAIDMGLVVTPTPEMITNGKALFQNNCASCHGAEGNGDGATGLTLNPKPRNFHSAEGWKNGRKISEIFKTLQKGVTGSAMSPYDAMPVQDRIAILSFIRATFMTDPPKDSEQELKDLDNTYSLSKGFFQAGQLPIPSASSMVLDAKKDKLQKFSKAISKVNNGSAVSEGREIFINITSNVDKAIATIVNADVSLSSVSSLRALVKSNPGQNGFNSKALYLGDDDYNTVLQFLRESL